MTSPFHRFSMTNPDGSLKTAEDLQNEANRLVHDTQARARAMQEEIAANVVEVTSKNQAVTVTVTATGALKSVRLSDRIKGMGVAMVSTSIMEAYHEACRQAAARTLEITRQEGGDRLAELMRTLVPDLAETEDGDPSAGGAR